MSEETTTKKDDRIKCGDHDCYSRFAKCRYSGLMATHGRTCWYDFIESKVPELLAAIETSEPQRDPKCTTSEKDDPSPFADYNGPAVIETQHILSKWQIMARPIS